MKVDIRAEVRGLPESKARKGVLRSLFFITTSSSKSYHRIQITLMSQIFHQSKIGNNVETLLLCKGKYEITFFCNN